MFSKNDPWSEDGVLQHQVAIRTVARALAQADDLSLRIPSLSDQLRGFQDDLTVILEAYRNSPDHYRRHRAFTAVDLPAISQCLETYASLENSSLSPVRMSEMEAGVAACLSAASVVRSSIETAAADHLELEVSLITGSDKPAPARTGLLDRARAVVSRSVEAGSSVVQPAAATVLARAGAGYDLSKTILGGAVSQSIDLVTSPLATRAAALGTALREVGETAGISGLVVSILLPPAAPFVVGLALLEAPDIYARSLDHSQRQRAKIRNKSQQDRDEAIAGALARLRGQSPVARVMTPCLNITINLETGAADGLVLVGRNTGRALSEINAGEVALMARTAPDPETSQALEAWIARKDENS